MQQNENAEQYIIVNTPKNLNLDLLFPTYQENLAKVEWLINQINHFSTGDSVGYTINVKKHNWLFSSANITGKIISTLIDNKIIYISKRYVKGQNAKAYKMINQFKADETSNQTFYKIDDAMNPKFIKRFIADGFVVKNKNTTSYVDESIILNVDTQCEESVKPTYKELLKKIKMLEISNTELQARLDAANAKAKQNRINRGVQEADKVITSVEEVRSLEPIITSFNDGNELITLENCDDLVIPDHEIETDHHNEIDSKGLTLTEIYYVLEEHDHDITSTDYSTYYQFEDFKISLINGNIVGEGNLKLIQNIIDDNAQAFLNRKKMAVA